MPSDQLAASEAVVEAATPVDSIAAISLFARGGGGGSGGGADSKSGFLLFLVSFSVISYHCADWLQPAGAVSVWDAKTAAFWFNWPNAGQDRSSALSMGV